ADLLANLGCLLVSLLFPRNLVGLPVNLAVLLVSFAILLANSAGLLVSFAILLVNSAGLLVGL
ncbi:hypothetical protein ACFQ9Y_24950, partial [Peribacillus simplex]|uniref:hypothetical protein n=1 Tax=Peribacillus simplex TaxID=1478 RepID=UPI00366C3DB7